MDINQRLTEELDVKRWQIDAAVQLIDEGNTIPFISRYRKEATGELNDEQLRKLYERLVYLRNLEEKKEQVISSIEEQGKLTAELKKQILDAQTLVVVEDLYRPFRPKRRTRAIIAKEKGLEPLANIIMLQMTVKPIEEEAQDFVEKIKKQYWDARHNCWAYSIGEKQPALRCSDDGEPSGTAGKPMLEVLTGQELHNVVAVVTRYFGGTLLGTGGLIRAYTKSTQEGIKASTIIEKCLGQKMSLTCDYTTSGKIQYLTATDHIPVLDTIYTDNVTFEMIIPVEDVEMMEKKFMEASMGKGVLEKGEESYYAEIDGEIKFNL